MTRFEGDDYDNQIPPSGYSNAGDDIMYGRGGDDYIDGGTGNDYVVGGAGADTLIGGTGIDTISYWDANGAGVVVNLTTMKASGAGSEAQGDTISGFENIEGVNHDQGHDILTGSAGANSILGNGGNDYIYGMAGNDTLEGGVGYDVIYGGDGNDTIQDLDQDNQLYGGTGNDRIQAGSASNMLDGGTGDDWLSCDPGTYQENAVNVLRGGAGADRIIGSFAKNDTATYSEGTVGVTINLTTNVASGGNAQGDVLSAIEHLVGSAGSDSLTANTGANTLDGGAGNDVLSGMDSNDLLRGGAGADRLDGQFGIDTASYYSGTTGVLVSLASGLGSGGEAQGDTLFGIENVSGSQGSDSLYGNAGANVLQGWNGSDALFGRAGKDTLTGGAGADRYHFTALGDSVVGANADRITDFSHAQGDKIDLSGIDASTGAAGNQAFRFLGTGAYTHHAGELHYYYSGSDTVVSGDVNGDGASDFNIVLSGHLGLVAGDFTL
ncbi:calcium-binding protein [Inquilinus sp. CA228]|uniref:calcium-binding protein n=1 Tax=Inquilinus sp. CA228 TaxID=3455609 RepID=UPI003F8D0597